MLQKTVETLEALEERVKQKGYKIQYAYGNNKNNERTDTFCALLKEEDGTTTVSIGKAKKHPNDSFDKRLGRLKALGRAYGKNSRYYVGTQDEFLREFGANWSDDETMPNIISAVMFLLTSSR